MKKVILLLAVLLSISGCNPTTKREEQIDHIILAINDLDKGIAIFAERTGVTPVFGGVHPHSFTHNALVALDNNAYIEIMAPRPDAENVPEYITLLDDLTPVGWAVRTMDIDQTRLKLEKAGFTLTDNQSGSREKPDGTTLAWTVFGVESTENLPFFIKWEGASIHPSASSPQGCKLKSLQVAATEKAMLDKLEEQVKLGFTAVQGEKPRVKLTIQSPKGEVIFEAR